MSLEIAVNGKRTAAEEDSVAAFLARRGFCRGRVVVEYNGGILAPELWEETLLRSGDRLEIVTFVGGG